MIYSSLTSILLLSTLLTFNSAFEIVKSQISFKIRSSRTSLQANSKEYAEYAELLKKLESYTKATAKTTRAEVNQEVKQEVNKEAPTEIKSLEKQYQLATQSKTTATISTPSPPPVSIVKTENGGGSLSYLPIVLAVAVIPAGIVAFLKSKESEV